MSLVLEKALNRADVSTSLAGRLLIVRHGPGRGPRIRLRSIRPKYFEPVLRDFARRQPKLRSHIDVWETGTPDPDLSDVRAILFLLQDPVKELFPDCYRDAMRMASAASRRHIRLVNPPESLSNSIKSVQSKLWMEAGLPVPKQFAFRTLDEFHSALETTSFPAILRSDVLHSQTGMVFCQTSDEARLVAKDRLLLPGTLSEFIDTREGFRSTMPGTDWALYYHKKRAFVFGNRVRTNHVFFGKHPIVGCLSSTFDHHRSLNPIKRWLRNRACQKHIQLDLEYFARETEHEATLVSAANALGMEYAAIDYSSCADGQIVLWEANPHFCLHSWPFEVLAGPRKLNMRIAAYHQDMGRFFRELLQPRLT